MSASFQAISLSYQTAPIQVRESVAFNEEECRALLRLVQDCIPATDILVLSTCNRMEVYYQAEEDHSTRIIGLIALQKGISDKSMLVSYFKVMAENEEAMLHLFRVSMGLESQVMGDMHMANQVKRAYQHSADMGTAGPFLHRLMHTLFFTSKRVAQETGFRDGSASVSYATVELVRELTTTVCKPSVLVIGLGEIGSDIGRNLCKAAFGSVTVANRTLEKSLAFAEEYPVTVVEWDQLAEQIPLADVVISAVPGLQSFLTKAHLEKTSFLSPKYFIDLSIPRSIEPAIEEIAGVYLYNVDDIRNKASVALEKRKAAIPAVNQLMAEALAEFQGWANEMMVTPVIQEFKAALEQIRQQELKRYVKHLTEEENQRIELITKSIIQKILKLPVLQLKAACQRGEADQLSEGLRSLFNLEAPKEAVGV
ncbi:MAG: glutamyl-tRNA reductase [Bacteroidota bacterium]